MGNSDDDSDFAQYGTALEAIEEDEVARKKPITVAEQVAVDERGRRRFHGAFTGGFSAGYFNTVGSKEGWAPSTFKSSRADRGGFKNQNVLDFMDDEDKGAFGIAPQILRPTDDFTDKNDSRTRKRPLANKQTDGPIPGMPVLDQIIQPVKETVGIKILVRMGWRPGKGVGPKIQRKAKAKKARIERPEIVELELDDEPQSEEQEQENNNRKIYSCPLPPGLKKGGSDSEESDDYVEAEELLAPDDVSALLCNPKENSFGLGYKGLDRNALTSGSSHVDLFGGNKLKFRVENKHMSISGEAFGVGAFEDNDEDIYSREDMSQYDFALETPEERKRRRAKEELAKRKSKTKDNCIEGFKIASSAKLKKRSYPPPHLPPNFEPFHVVKKSRFESGPTSAIADKNEKEEAVAKGLGRHSLTISERQVLIEDDVNKVRKEASILQAESTFTATEPTDKSEDPPGEAKQSAQVDDDIQHRIERLKKFTQVLQAYSSKKPEENQKASFKPFMKNPEKQERYEKYLTLLEAGFSESLRDLQPPEMAEWERDREKMEFERASKLYKPMSSILSSRFTSAKSHDISHLEPERESVKEKDPKDDPKVAAKMKLFGKLTHRVMEWHPDKLVCKRFNVPHPYPDSKFVGVKGDPSTRTASNPALLSQKQTVAATLPVPKKSLFENLDFSKPPPGLLPAEPPPQSSSTDFPMECSDESGVGIAPSSILAFQKELSTKAAADDADAESVPPEEAVRPPIDLFKEIFADSSDESEEEDDRETPQSRMNQGKENERTQQHSKSHDKPTAFARDDKASDKIPSSHYGGKSPRENESVNQPTSITTTAPYKRRVFDKIDLDRLQDHAHNPTKSNEELSDKILRKGNDDGGRDEDVDMYGPLPSSSSSVSGKASASRQDPPKPKFIPRGSSSVATPVSSSAIMNYKHQSSSSHDERKKEANTEEVVWVEKSALSDRSSKSHVKSKKHSSSSKKSRRKSSSSKKDKHKSHKSSKKHKQKKKASGKHKSKGKHHRRERKDGESSSSSTSEGDEDGSGASSDSSVTINDSLDNRALLAKLKQITRSN